MTMPVRPLLTELPLGMLPEDVFERFSTDLASLLYPHPDVVHGYGSRGHKQYGIDIEGYPKLSLKKYKPIAARNEDANVSRGLL